MMEKDDGLVERLGRTEAACAAFLSNSDVAACRDGADALTAQAAEIERLREDLNGLQLAACVADAAVQFCGELREDAGGVPQPELKALHQALDDWEGVPRALGLFDSREPAKAALSDIANDVSLTDGQRRAAAAAFHGLEQAAAEIERLRLERDEARDQFDQHVAWASEQASKLEATIEALRKQVVALGGVVNSIMDRVGRGPIDWFSAEMHAARATLAALPAELAGMVLIERDALAAAIPYIYEIRDDAGSKAAEKVRRRLIAAQEGK